MQASEAAVEDQPLVELAPEEAVLPALMQSAHPVEFVEANPADTTESKEA